MSLNAFVYIATSLGGGRGERKIEYRRACSAGKIQNKVRQKGDKSCFSKLILFFFSYLTKVNAKKKNDH